MCQVNSNSEKQNPSVFKMQMILLETQILNSLFCEWKSNRFSSFCPLIKIRDDQQELPALVHWFIDNEHTPII